MKITHEKFEEKLKELGAEQVRLLWAWDRNNGKNTKVKRTYGEFQSSRPGSPAFRVRAEYQQGKVTGVIIGGNFGAIYLPKSSEIDEIMALFEKIKILKKFVGDES